MSLFRFFPALLLAIWLGACVESVTADDSERTITPPPTAEFDPQNKVIPLPNDLLLDPMTHRLDLPATCGETPSTATIRTQVLNQLDGFGTSKTVIQTTFTQPVDPASLMGRVFLVRVASNGIPADGTEGPVPVTIMPGKTTQASADCATSAIVDDITIVPQMPLRGSSTYAVALLSGIASSNGGEFQPSTTWALVRQPTDPVQLAANGQVAQNNTPFSPSDPAGLAAIQGLDQLWKATAPILTFFDMALPAVAPMAAAQGRNAILLAWAFDTQTITSPYQREVMGSPASQLASPLAPDSFLVAQTIPADQVDAFYTANVGPGTCATLGCAAIGAIELGGFASPSFQSGDDCRNPPMMPPGAWSDPIHPNAVCYRMVSAIAVVPRAAAPAGGYPTVIFGHGLSRSKEDLLAFGGRLASQGIASIAIDAVDHGERAVRISMDPQQGCAAAGTGNTCSMTIGPTCAPQCYAPILSTDLAATRDNLRQTILDTLKLERVMLACGPSACGALAVDPAHLGYVGQSLGAILGGVTVAVSPAIKAGVLNVGAGDWVQIFSFTASTSIRCPLIDALIDAGVLMGAKWNLGTNPSALCLDPNAAWRQDPSYLAFASIARWVLDPADPVDFAASLRAAEGPHVFLQEVAGDQVVPNEATDPYGALLGSMKMPAAVATSAMPMPTMAALSPGSQWIQYSTIPADPATAFPGNTYAHGSLLLPATADAAGLLGTAQMQTDVITYLVTHL